MKSGSLRTTFYDYLRIFFHRMDYIALCMVLALAGAALYTFVLAEEVYRATGHIYVTQVGDTALLSGLTKVSSLRDRLTLINQLINSESNIKEITAKFWPLARQFPGDNGIQRQTLKYLQKQLEENPRNEYFRQAIADAEANLQLIKARDARAAQLVTALQENPDEKQAARELSKLQTDKRREEWEISEAIARFQTDLRVRLLYNVVEVSYASTEPQLAKAVVDEVMGEVIDKHLELQTAEIGFAEKVYEDQVERYIKQTQDARAALEGYAKVHPEEYAIPLAMSSDAEKNLVSLEMLPAQQSETLKAYRKVEEDLAEANMRVKETQKRIEQLKDQLKGEPASVVSQVVAQTPPEVQKIRDQIGELQLQLSGLLVDATEEHPMVVQLRKRILLLEEYLGRIGESVAVSEVKAPNPVREQIMKQLQQEEAELPALEAREQALLGRSTLYQEKIRHIPERELDLEALRVDYLQKKSTLAMYRGKLEQARINRQLEIEEKGTRLRMDTEAEVPFKPVRPDKRLYMIMGLLVGMFASGATIFFLEYTDHSIKGVEDARRYLDMPVLGAIPEFGQEKRGLLGWLSQVNWGVWATAILIIGIVVGIALSPMGRGLSKRTGRQTLVPLRAFMPIPTEEVTPTATPAAPEVEPQAYIIVTEPRGGGK